MESVPTSTLLENLCLQQQEVEMLQAMFPGEKEVVWDDPTLPLDIEEYINSSGRTPGHIRFLSFDVNIESPINELNLNNKIYLCISISLPTLYPDVHPNISVTSNELTRTNQSQINHDLMNYMSSLECGEMILLNLISWLQENVIAYYSVIDNLKEKTKVENKETEEELLLMCFYMHHIYSKDKRTDMINWANELCLTGFILPGKPGIVYVEGYTGNVTEYYARVKKLNWKKMTCKVDEKCEERVFKHFEELSFDVHGGRENHMDMGKFFLFLKEKGLGYIFKELFGVEGHC